MSDGIVTSSPQMTALRELLETSVRDGSLPGAVAILLTQVQMAGPTPTPLMRDFWRYSAT